VPTKKVTPVVQGVSLKAKIDKALEGRDGYNLAQKLLKGAKSRVGTTFQTDVRNALKQGQRAVTSPKSVGITGISSSPSSVRVNDRDGNVAVNIPSWRPLTKPYASKKPKSKTFWKKSGSKPLGNRTRSLRQAYSDAIKTKATVRAAQSPLKKSGDKAYSSVITLKISGVKPPLDKIIVDSFIKGRPAKPRKPAKNIDRSSVAVVSYPERDRPLLGYIAASLGDRSKERIARKFLENLQVRSNK
jgi:hypothetical protein